MLTILGTLMGCKSAETPSLINEPISEDPNAPTPGIISSTAGFNIKVNPPDGANYYIHRDNDFTKGCVVEPSTTAVVDKDIFCTVEIEELEGMFHGVEMVLNTPPNMCAYVRYYPYFFFGKEYGFGPPTGSLPLLADGSYAGGGTFSNGNAYFDPDGNPVCRFDYSTSGGPNCCLGSVNVTVTQGADPPYSVVREWGGKPGDCVAGVGADSSAKDEITNMPLAVIYNVVEGLSETFSTGGSSLLKGIGSLHYSNYYPRPLPATDDGNLASHPAAFMLTSAYRGSPYYDWQCLDEANELRARIRVRIREWNEVSQFLIAASGGDPDTTGVEADFGLFDINDYTDWEDFFYDGFPPSVLPDTFPGIPN